MGSQWSVGPLWGLNEVLGSLWGPYGVWGSYGVSPRLLGVPMGSPWGFGVAVGSAWCDGDRGGAGSLPAPPTLCGPALISVSGRDFRVMTSPPETPLCPPPPLWGALWGEPICGAPNLWGRLWGHLWGSQSVGTPIYGVIYSAAYGAPNRWGSQSMGSPICGAPDLWGRL